MSRRPLLTLISLVVALGQPGAGFAQTPQPARNAGAPAAATPAPPLDLAGAVAAALAHDPGILAKVASLANLESQFVKAHAAEFPTVAGQLMNQISKSANAQGQFAAFGLSQQSVFSQNTAQVFSQWQLYNGSLSQVTAQEDLRDVQAARSDVRHAQYQLVEAVAASYYGLAGKRDAVTLAVSNRDYERALLAAARANERVGRAAGVDTLRAEVAATRAEAALVSAQADEADAREALANQIGVPLETAFGLPAQLPRPALPGTTAETLVQEALARRSDILSARTSVAAAQLANSAIDTDLRPQVALTGSFGNQTSPTEFVSEQQQIDLQNAATIANYNFFRSFLPASKLPPLVLLPNVVRGTPGFWQIGVQASFTVPLIEYGTRRAAHRAAQAQITAQQGALANTLSAVELDVRKALRGSQTNSTNLDLAEASARLAAEAARVARLQYENGLISFTDANATQQTEVQAQTDLTNARISYILAAIRLRCSLEARFPAADVEVGGL